MTKVICLIDGFNLYHSIDEATLLSPYKWLDLQSFAKSFTRPDESLADVFYFTALAFWNYAKQEKHKRYIRVLQDRGVRVIYGKFKNNEEKCRICHQRYQSPEEKRTDVNIAASLFRLAYENRYDTALLVSGDTDLAPAVEAVRDCFPGKRVGVLFPMRRKNLELAAAAHFSVNIKPSSFLGHRLPDSVLLRDGTTITCPTSWMLPP